MHLWRLEALYAGGTRGSVYERVFTHGEPVLIEDLTTYTPRSAIEDTLIQHGMRNLVVAPLLGITIR